MASLPNAAYVGEPHFHSVNNEDAVYLVHPTTAKVVCMPASVSEEKLKAAADKYCQDLGLDGAAISWHMNSSHFTIFPHGSESLIWDCRCTISHDPATPVDPSRKHSNYLLCSGDDEADLCDYPDSDDESKALLSTQPRVPKANSGAGSQSQVEQQMPYIKRPPNAWLLYLKVKRDELRAANSDVKFGDAAKVISDMWKRETAEVRAHYIQLSKDKAAQHKDMFPMYKFGDFYGMANKGRKVDRKGVALEEGDINK